MIALKMNHRNISNLNRLRDNFNAVDLIKQRLEFSSFANAHLKMRDIDRYHVRIFSETVRCMEAQQWEQAGFVKNYWDNPLKLKLMDDAIQLSLSVYTCPESGTLEEREVQITEQLYQMVLQTQLSDEDKQKLYYLLAAGYLLTGTSLESKPVSTAELEEAYLGKQRSNVPCRQILKWTELPTDSEELSLPSQKESYRFLLYTEKAITKEERIKTLRFIAGQPTNGSRYLVTNIELFRDRSDVLPIINISLKPGEFLYMNVVGGKIIKVMEISVKNGDHRLERRDLSEESLYLYQDAYNYQKLPGVNCTNAGSFAVEKDSLGYLIIQNYRLNASHYSNRASYTQFSTIEYRRTVEVKMIEDDYLVLQDNGRVYSSRAEWDQLRDLPTLDLVQIREV